MSKKQKIKGLKGMNDLFEDELYLWRKVEQAAKETFLSFGYGEIRTPILEETKLFVRSVGESSDVVSKEMYAFTDQDKKQTSLCLRPENTAGVVRSLIQHGKLPADSEAKVFYMGPMFRRERPQKGRYRQFHQLGCEAYGFESASIDVELMAMLHQFTNKLELQGAELVINSLGDPEDRLAYTTALKTYLEPLKAELSEDSQRRLEQNPLRILDSKSPQDREIAENAPKPIDYLGEAAKHHFTTVKVGLDFLEIPYKVDPLLVRGLDYYSRTVFELLADNGLGSQNAIAAGGRYENLVEELGGRSTSAIGFGAGIERIILLLQAQSEEVIKSGIDLMIVAAEQNTRLPALKLANQLRSQNISVEIDHRGRSFKAQQKRASRSGAKYSLIFGSTELESRKVQLKDMQSHQSQEIILDAKAIGTKLK